MSCKGTMKALNEEILTLGSYKQVLFEQTPKITTNRGFRLMDEKMITYTMHKTGLTPIYTKRIVLDDKVTTAPLNL